MFDSKLHKSHVHLFSIPGGWYLVSNLYEDDDQLDVLIHSEKLELISNVSSRMLPGQNESRQIMSR